MKIRKNPFVLLVVISVLLLTGCRNNTIPEDFNISFQYGQSDSTIITIDTYNGIISKGIDQKNRQQFNMSSKDKKKIYKAFKKYNIKSFDGQYRGSSAEPGNNVRFAIKFTANRKTSIVSGDNTTKSHKEKDTSPLLKFRDYMIEYIEGLDEYSQLQ